MFITIAILIIIAGVIFFIVGGQKDNKYSAEKGLFSKYKRQYEGQPILLVRAVQVYKQPLHVPDGLKVAWDLAIIPLSILGAADGDIHNTNEINLLLDTDDTSKTKKRIPSNAYILKSMPIVMIKPGMFLEANGLRAMIIAIFHDKSSTGFGAASPGQIVDVVIQFPGFDGSALASQLNGQKIIALKITQAN